MIKTLKKKFVKTAMSAVTVLLLIFILSVNVFNILMTYRQSSQKLDAVSGNLIRFDIPGERENRPGVFPAMQGESDKPDFDENGFPQSLPERAPLFGISRDDAEGARFFKVEYDSSGEPVSVNIERISSVTEDEAKEYALSAVNSDDTKGRSGKFLYSVHENRMQGKTVTFLDVSSEMNRSLTVTVVSLGAGVLCWLIMFLITNRISSRAIKPIAENIEKQKQFVSDAGHEIKTPLAVIKANTEAMELYNGENKWSNNIKAQVDRLNGLMQELLLLSKADEGVPESSLDTVSLSDLSRRMTQAFGELAASENKTLTCNIEDGITVNSDTRLLERIIDILLDNAVKYSSEGSEIKYTLAKDKKHSEIRVENRCDELPGCEPAKLFDRFYRGDSSRNSEGFGIGLASARSSAESLGCRLTADYKDENTIEFTLRI